MTVGFRQIRLETEGVTVFLTVGTDGPQFIGYAKPQDAAVSLTSFGPLIPILTTASYAPTHLSDFREARDNFPARQHIRSVELNTTRCLGE